jgi:hypothetical protein
MRLVTVLAAVVAVIAVGLFIGFVASRPSAVAPHPAGLAAVTNENPVSTVQTQLSETTAPPAPTPRPVMTPRPLAATPTQLSAAEPKPEPGPASVGHVPLTDREAIDAAWNEKLSLRPSNSQLFSYAYEHARNGDVETIKQILDAHPEFVTNSVGNYRSTLLHTAAFNGRTDAVTELLNRQADVNVQNTEGHTPLYDSIRSGNIEVIRTLLEHGADMTIPTQTGDTPFKAAMQAQRADILELLKQWGEKP